MELKKPTIENMFHRNSKTEAKRRKILRVDRELNFKRKHAAFKIFIYQTELKL